MRFYFSTLVETQNQLKDETAYAQFSGFIDQLTGNNCNAISSMEEEQCKECESVSTTH